MMMKFGKSCELCNIIFASKEMVLEHFMKEHSNIILVKLSEFIKETQYLSEDEST